MTASEKIEEAQRLVATARRRDFPVGPAQPVRRYMYAVFACAGEEDGHEPFFLGFFPGEDERIVALNLVRLFYEDHSYPDGWTSDMVQRAAEKIFEYGLDPVGKFQIHVYEYTSDVSWAVDGRYVSRITLIPDGRQRNAAEGKTER